MALRYRPSGSAVTPPIARSRLSKTSFAQIAGLAPAPMAVSTPVMLRTICCKNPFASTSIQIHASFLSMVISWISRIVSHNSVVAVYGFL